MGVPPLGTQDQGGTEHMLSSRGSYVAISSRLAPRIRSLGLVSRPAYSSECSATSEGRYPDRVTSPKTRVRFLLGTADGANGVARTVFTTAGYLADRYDVEIIGLFQRRDRPVFPVPSGVTLTFLEDIRPRRDNESWKQRVATRLRRLPSRLIERPLPGRYPGCSLLTDLLLVWKLRTMRSGVLITTRPELHLMAARFAPTSLVLIAQEHMNYHQRPQSLRQDVARYADRIDALVLLTERDRQDYLAYAEWEANKVFCIPNSMPWDVVDRPAATGMIVVAVGRLARQKGFDRLVEAFAPAAKRHPDWALRVYGIGPLQTDLQTMIDERGIGDQATLMGWTDHLGDALDEASVFALSSRFEGLPLVMIEALSKGLPAVSFDCPRGPRELIHNGENGFLVPDGDIAAFTEALDNLMSSPGLRAQMSRAAFGSAREFEISRVGARWEELLVLLSIGEPSHPGLIRRMASTVRRRLGSSTGRDSRRRIGAPFARPDIASAPDRLDGADLSTLQERQGAEPPPDQLL